MESLDSLLHPSLERCLKGHQNGVTSLFYSPDERKLASSSYDNSILLWDIGVAIKSYRFQGHTDAVMDVTFSPSGKHMASVSRDKTVRIWAPSVTGSTGVFKAHSQTVRSVQYSYDGSKILTCSDDKIVKLWSSAGNKFISSFVGHTNWVRCARICGDGSMVASCSDDKTVRLWDLQSGDCVHIYKEKKGYAAYLSWHPSNCYIAVGTSQGEIKLYDIRTHSLVQYYSIHNDIVTGITFHPSGSYLLTASRDAKMKMLDLLEGHPVFTLSGHKGGVNVVAFSSSGDFFATGSDDKMVFLWKTNFMKLGDENDKENSPVNNSVPGTSHRGRKKQGIRNWYMCHHSTQFPYINFEHVDEPTNSFGTFGEEPNANSTFIENNPTSQLNRTLPRNVTIRSKQSTNSFTENLNNTNIENSHTPRPPPSRTTYTIPSIMKETQLLETKDKEDLFGIIKLNDDDVCYTSGTIEWVGRKRSFPINSGFKIINKSIQPTEPAVKKPKSARELFLRGVDKIKECDCADVLPTVNAIVDHLNALHEAVDIVDFRLNTVEESIINNNL